MNQSCSAQKVLAQPLGIACSFWLTAATPGRYATGMTTRWCTTVSFTLMYRAVRDALTETELQLRVRQASLPGWPLQH
jgi:hypothetical protein